MKKTKKNQVSGTSKQNAQEKLKEAKRKNFVKNNFLSIVMILILLVVGLIVFAVSNKNIEDKENEANLAYGDDVIDMYYFHLSTCPHCHKQNAFHPQLKAMYPNLRINEYEMTSVASQQKLKEIAEQYPEFDLSQFGTPTSFIGEEFNIGYGSDETTGQTLIAMIEKEQRKIEENWNESTMVKTIDLRMQQEVEQ